RARGASRESPAGAEPDRTSRAAVAGSPTRPTRTVRRSPPPGGTTRPGYGLAGVARPTRAGLAPARAGTPAPGRRTGRPAAAETARTCLGQIGVRSWRPG